MRLAREIERRLERLFDGVSAAVFRGRMQPVDLANRLVRHADFLVEDGKAGPQIPNSYAVGVNPGDISDATFSDPVARELALAVNDTARDRGWRLEGPVTVTLELDDDVRAGSISCGSGYAIGELPVWGQLVDAKGGRVLEMRHNRELIGRAEDADLLLEEPEASRHHAVLFTEGGRTYVADLGSANGTLVNSAATTGAASPIHAGDTVTFGPATFTFRLA